MPTGTWKILGRMLCLMGLVLALVLPAAGIVAHPSQGVPDQVLGASVSGEVPSVPPCDGADGPAPGHVACGPSMAHSLCVTIDGAVGAVDNRPRTGVVLVDAVGSVGESSPPFHPPKLFVIA